MPVYHNMPQCSDGAFVELSLGMLETHYLMEVKIDHGGQTADLGLAEHSLGVIKAGGHGLFGKHRLGEFERADSDLALQDRYGGDGNCLHGIVFNQRAPAAVCSWHIACTGEL